MHAMGIILIFLMIRYGETISVKLIPETGSPPPFREVPGFTVDSQSSKLYVYGGGSEVKHSDMWEFDLNTQRWSQIHPGSIYNPGPRSDTFITALQDNKNIILFGGDTDNGPISDVWIYNIENETVILT